MTECVKRFGVLRICKYRPFTIYLAIITKRLTSDVAYKADPRMSGRGKLEVTQVVVVKNSLGYFMSQVTRKHIFPEM